MIHLRSFAMTGLVRLFLAALAGAVLSLAAQAQDFPSRVIRIISPTPAGGPSDIALRPFAQELSAILGQPVIVENRPGAGGTLAGRACAQATPDGHTICNFLNDVVSNAPFFFKNPGYDPYKDLMPITNGYFIVTSILVTPELKVNTLAELIELSKKTPGGLNYASPSTGATMFIESFNQHTGSNFRTIPYRSGGEVANSLLSNTTQVGIIAIGAMAQHVQSGKFKALAVDSAERLAQFPDVPTLKELGYEKVRIKTWYGMFAPAGTPQPIIKTLHQAIVKIYNESGFRQRTLTNAGLELATSNPEDFAKFLQEDRERTAVQAARAKVEPQ
jgi:tripartite-type tricarboxylate transporter receptor subunit TctC